MFAECCPHTFQKRLKIISHLLIYTRTFFNLIKCTHSGKCPKLLDLCLDSCDLSFVKRVVYPQLVHVVYVCRSKLSYSCLLSTRFCPIFWRPWKTFQHFIAILHVTGEYFSTVFSNLIFPADLFWGKQVFFTSRHAMQSLENINLTNYRH